MKLLKYLLFYLTAILTTLLICSVTINLQFFCLLLVDFVLILLCKHTLTLREVVRISGYSIWYKMLH